MADRNFFESMSEPSKRDVTITRWTPKPGDVVAVVSHHTKRIEQGVVRRVNAKHIFLEGTSAVRYDVRTHQSVGDRLYTSHIQPWTPEDDARVAIEGRMLMMANLAQRLLDSRRAHEVLSLEQLDAIHAVLSEARGRLG